MHSCSSRSKRLKSDLLLMCCLLCWSMIQAHTNVALLRCLLLCRCCRGLGLALALGLTGAESWAWAWACSRLWVWLEPWRGEPQRKSWRSGHPCCRCVV